MLLRGGTPEPWEEFADAVLRALDDHAGEAVEAARASLLASLDEPSLFTATTLTADLPPKDAEVLALLLAVEVDRERQLVVGRLLGADGPARMSVGLLARLLPDGHLAVGPDAPLQRAGLVEVERDGPWASRVAAVPGPVTWNFSGDHSKDPDLPVRHRLITAGVPPVGDRELLFVCGGDRETRARLALERFGGVVLVVPMPDAVPQWDAVVRMATVGMMAVVVEVDESLPPLAVRYLTRAAHLAWGVSSEVELPVETLPDRAWVEVKAEDAIASAKECEVVFGELSPTGAHLTREQLRLVAAAADALGGDTQAAIRRLSAGHLDRMAVRIRPRRTWSDLVLPPDQMERVQELATRHRHRRTVYSDWGFLPLPSSGVVALFSGPSGTGKTLAAEVIAGDLGLDLFKLDLSSVVSKYIGETEKNLEAVFTAAEMGDTVLFFDEADALLGKRSEVSDAHDRYANLEVAYLLQRLERHDGIVLLATNLAKNIDDAFLRRIHVSVEFPIPKEPERLTLWRRSFPPTCPIEDLDFSYLAERFELTGGTIRNVTLTAAFLAAEAGVAVSMALVFAALRAELQKLGRLVDEGDFLR